MEIFQKALEKDEDFMNHLLNENPQKFLDMERDQQIRADKHIRNDKKQGMRNGYKDRKLNTRVE